MKAKYIKHYKNRKMVMYQNIHYLLTCKKVTPKLLDESLTRDIKKKVLVND